MCIRDRAYAILSSTNNFPEFTGRICPAPCETACVLGINQPAITIEEIEKHIIEIAFEKGFVLQKKACLWSAIGHVSKKRSIKNTFTPLS